MKRKLGLMAAMALLLTATLSGCIVAPWWDDDGGYYGHHHGGHGHYRGDYRYGHRY